MSQSEQPNKLRTVLNTLAEMVGYPAVFVSYILALSGRLPGNFPTTTSIATIVTTSLLVVAWRWRAINQTKQPAPALIYPQPANSNAGQSFLNRLFEPLTGRGRKNYVYSPARRRLEGFLSLGVLMIGVVWTFVRAPAALGEFADPLLTCNPQQIDHPLRVFVADMLETGSKEPLLVEDRLYEFLSEHEAEGQFQVCRWAKAVSVRSEAKAVALNNRADMLVWGRRDVIYEIHLEVPAWENVSKTLSETSSQEATSATFQLTEPTHLGYVTEFTMSELMFLNNQVVPAQARLTNALRRARLDPAIAGYSHDIAEGYFLLGLFYDPNVSAEHADPQKALDAYSQAFALQPDLFAAVLNRGVINLNQGQTQAALTDFDLLIERDTPLKCSAYINRAALQSDPQAEDRDLEAAIACADGPDKAEGYFFRGSVRMERQDYQGAIKDFKQAVALEPEEYYHYHLLGMAQLYAGQIEDARETYRQITPTLDESSRQQVLDELARVAQQRQDLDPAIQEISRLLNSARLRSLVQRSNRY